MSDNNNRNQRNAAATSATAMAAAVAAGLAFEHMHAQHNNRESVVQGLRRWFSDTITDATRALASPSDAGGGGGGGRTRGHFGGSPYYPGGGSGLSSAGANAGWQTRRRLMRSEIDALPVRVVTDVDAIDGSRDDIDGEVGGTSTTTSTRAPDKAFCVVCREHYGRGDRLLRLPCFHEFHSGCIRDYLESTEGPLCPICRHPVVFS